MAAALAAGCATKVETPATPKTPTTPVREDAFGLPLVIVIAVPDVPAEIRGPFPVEKPSRH